MSYRVGDINTSVDNVGTNTSASTFVVNVRAATFGLMRDASKTPRSLCLRGIVIDRHNAVFLDVLDLVNRVSPSHLKSDPGYTCLGNLLDRSKGRSIKLGSEPLEARGLVHMLGLGGPKLAQGIA